MAAFATKLTMTTGFRRRGVGLERLEHRPTVHRRHHDVDQDDAGREHALCAHQVFDLNVRVSKKLAAKPHRAVVAMPVDGDEVAFTNRA